MAFSDYRGQCMEGRTKRVTSLGGVPARADGGSVNPKAAAAKKKAGTTVNIVIAGGGQGGAQAPMRPAQVMAAPAAPMAPRPMPPAAPAGLGMAPPPPGAPMPMRKRGGAVKMDAGAASGLGRLEKTRNAK